MVLFHIWALRVSSSAAVESFFVVRGYGDEYSFAKNMMHVCAFNMAPESRWASATGMNKYCG